MQSDVAFWQKFIGLTPEYTVIRTDYTTYPTYIDNDGDVRPTYDYLKSLNDQVVALYGEFAFDFVMVMIHQDNWLSSPSGSKGIWGTNYSYVFGKQCLDYCRWDKRNDANTFGTAYHERHHSFDAIIKQETGETVESKLNVPIGKYDYCITHGNCGDWQYIRWKENTTSLKIMAPYLRKAFMFRRGLHADNEKRKTIIQLLEQAVYVLRMLNNRKNGVPRK